MNQTDPFAGHHAGWLDISRSVSEICDDSGCRSLEWFPADDGSFSAEDKTAVFTMTVTKCAAGCKILITARWKQKLPEHFVFTPLHFPALTVDHAFFCGERTGQARSARFPLNAGVSFSGRHYAVLTKEKESVLFSTPLEQDHDNFFRGTGDGKLLLNLRCDFEFHHNDIEGTTVFDPITITAGNGISLLEQYGNSCRKNEQDFSQKPEYGWNSWDYYRWTISEEEVLKNAEFIAADPVLKQHVKRIIVDDGWQYCYGEWEANPLFPHGMKYLADELHKMGFKAGLWLAPAIVEPHCRIAQLDYDMLACSEGGQPCLAYECMARKGFVLDPTVPKTQKYIERLIDRYASMGYEYFKLDFLSSVMNAPRFSDRKIPRCRILRLLMDAVSRGAAGRSEILGCNYHFYNGTSYVNAVRVGGDIHSSWQSIKSNTVSVAGMFWANKKLWLNDPDFALCRNPETSDDPDIQRLKPCLVFCGPQSGFQKNYERHFASTTLTEQQVLLSIDLISGGAVNLSDNMPMLNESGLELARKIVTAESGSSGIPLDIFERQLPVYWHQKLKKGGRFLVINWEDEEQNFEIDLSCAGNPAGLRDFWNGKVEKTPSRITLPPHSCKLWEY